MAGNYQTIVDEIQAEVRRRQEELDCKIVTSKTPPPMGMPMRVESLAIDYKSWGAVQAGVGMHLMQNGRPLTAQQVIAKEIDFYGVRLYLEKGGWLLERDREGVSRLEEKE